LPSEGPTPSSFYEASIKLIPKTDKDTRKKEKYRPISLINIDVKIGKPNSTSHQKDHTPCQFHSRKKQVQHVQINQCNTPYKQNQGQRPHDQLNSCRIKAFDNVQNHFMVKELKKLGVGGMYHNIVKAIFQKHI
jgi:hypothetical protein